jgi:DNA-binding transcriptional LysR family regulator
MQLQQLVYFIAVAETRHFGRAAQQVHVAQPSLSQQIRALERELGAELFHRARGNIALTDAGEALLPVARRMLADADNARAEVQEIAGLRRGRVRLGAPPSLCAALVPRVLAAFHRRHPGIQLLIEEGGSRDLVSQLATGSLDLALVIVPLQRNDPALTTTELFNEDLVVVSPGRPGRPGGAQAGRVPAPVRITDLRDRPLVMFRHGYDLRETTLAACRAEGFEPTYAVEGGEMDTVISLVEAGLGTAVVPSTVAARHDLPAAPFAAPGLTRTVALAPGIRLAEAAPAAVSRRGGGAATRRGRPGSAE